jgi:GNAT superfamily N-acetyltransferase
VAVEAEAIERAALADLHAAATPELVAGLGLRSLEIGTGLVSVAAGLPASAIVINRAIGLGLGAAETEQSVGEMLAAYRSTGVARFFVQRHPEARPAELVDWLAEAGLEKARGWQKFHRGREAVPDVRTDLRVSEVGPEHGEAFGRIVCDAFDLGDAAVPWLARLPGRAGWHVLMSFDGEEPAGAGALFVQGGVAWTDFGATAPAFRRRGSQGAVLAARIQLAIDLGCRAIHTCTGEDVPGDPQHSYRNIKKLRFREEYIRENYAPPKP